MFSGAVKLGNLDDYLGPAQDCVVELFQDEREIDEEEEVKRRAFDLKEISADILKGDKPDLIKNDMNTEGGAKVSLYDCLACNGCVTTAEVMLLSSQSNDFFKEMLISRMYGSEMSLADRNGDIVRRRMRRIALSLSHPSLSALTAHYGLQSEQKMFKQLSGFLNTKSIDFTSSQSFGDAVVLLEQSWSVSHSTPITSQCPGWVCYAEKTCEKVVLDAINRQPSGMMIQGQLIKEIMSEAEKCRALTCSALLCDPMTSVYTDLAEDVFNDALLVDLPASEIGHVAVMACYDKKLESLRPEFQLQCNDGETCPIVDLVLGTNEFIEWLNDEGFLPMIHYPLPSLIRDPFQVLSAKLKRLGRCDLRYHPSRCAKPFLDLEVDGSGGMAVYGKRALSREVVPSSYSVVKGPNKDFRKVVDAGKRNKVMSSLPYGLRNLTNLATLIERNGPASLGGVVEAMACPSGCRLGGAHASLTEGNFEGDPYGVTKSNYSTVVNSIANNQECGYERYYTPDKLPEVIVFGHYLSWKQGNGEEALECVKKWNESLPQFQFLNLKEGNNAGDVNW